jgi:6-phosphogluconate dehydrogenase
VAHQVYHAAKKSSQVFTKGGQKMSDQSTIAVYGLGPMGLGLVQNFLDHGASVVATDKNEASTRALTTLVRPDLPLTTVWSLEDLVRKTPLPRKIMVMIPSDVVPEVTGKLFPLLAPNDIVIDGGNTRFEVTEEQISLAAEKQIRYVGMGISGGAEGARKGPALMPGGDESAWPEIKELFKSIAATAVDGTSCCCWMGKGGAGHFVKMNHNGIEYAVMALIAEVFDIMYRGLGMTLEEIANVFDTWNKGRLNSFLLSASADILRTLDRNGEPYLNRVLDVVENKGTGIAAIMAGLNFGISMSIVGQALATRFMAARRSLREVLHDKYQPTGDSCLVRQNKDWESLLEQALYCSYLISYSQGFHQLQTASSRFSWDLPFSDIARIWTGGCIIRSDFLMKISEDFEDDPKLIHLLVAPRLMADIKATEEALGEILADAIRAKVQTPTLYSSWSYLRMMVDVNMSTRLTAAQRDFFGAHGLHLEDRDRSQTYHGPWRH